MAHWLVKSEPDVFSWDDLVKTGAKGEPWTGVRNHTAKLNLKAMVLGDTVFFYHSQAGKEIVGIAQVIREHYPDPTDESGKFGMVAFKAVKPLKNSVTLAQIKEDPKLKDMALLKQSRLSVSPVKKTEWDYILKCSNG